VKGLDKLKSGVVLLYPFLWSREYERGEEAGRKDRPVTVALVYGEKIALIPVTTQPPKVGTISIEVPEIEKQRAGLEVSKRQWVISTEMNIDIPSQSHYLESNNIIGAFSTAFMKQIKTAIRQSIAQVKQVPRR
jgi:hypothetical protein